MEKKHNFPIPFPALFALSVAVVVFACAIPVFAQGKPGIRVRAESTIETDHVLLGDISEITGGPDADRLASISLGYAPALGMTREIPRPQIALAIAAAGYSKSEIILDSPEKITIRRAGQLVTAQQIREAVEKAVLGGFTADKIEARIARLDVPGNIQVPAGKLELRATATNVRNLFSKFSVPVEVRVDDRTIRTFAANVEVEAFADVLVAAQDLSVNSRISETDVKFEKKRLVKPLTAYLLDPAALRGVMLIKNLSAGAEITSDTFVDAVVVKYGDVVSLEAVSGSIKLIISGEARGSGKIGDRIAVKNLQSGAILQAVVTDEGHARVAF